MPKRTDEELLCRCGHLYHDHERPYNERSKQIEFGHTGHCTKCECGKYRDVREAQENKKP